ncbi:unnamed protein product [Paramecium octaurelia]|nr:unnamed protein product [Paramecium octaurelia]
MICISPHKCQYQRKLCIECQYEHEVDIKQHTVLLKKFQEAAIKKLTEAMFEETSEITNLRMKFKSILSKIEGELKKIWEELSEFIQKTYDLIEIENQSYMNLKNENLNPATLPYADLEKLVQIIEGKNQMTGQTRKIHIQLEQKRLRIGWTKKLILSAKS